MFPGQGTQYIDIYKELLRLYPKTQHFIDEASRAIDYNLQALSHENSGELLNNTQYAQPLILTGSVALYNFFMDTIGVEPDYMIGHSLGEITALCCSGAIDFYDAVQLVYTRGKLFNQYCSDSQGGMIAVMDVDEELILHECHKVSNNNDKIYLSNYNSSNQYVLSGKKHLITNMMNRLLVKGIKVVELNVQFPFHCDMMKDAKAAFSKALSDVSFKACKIPVLSTVNLELYEDKTDIHQILTEQITAPVRWSDSISYLKKLHVHDLIDVGPKDILHKLIANDYMDMKSFSLVHGLNTIIESDIIEVSKTIQEKGLLLCKVCKKIVATTMNYNRDSTLDYSKWYNDISKIQKNIEEDKIDMTIEVIKNIYTLFNDLLIAKQIRQDEYKNYMREAMEASHTVDMIDWKIIRKENI